MIRIFKASSASSDIVQLNRSTIRQNRDSFRETNILLDTNILITIDAAYQTDQRHRILKETGIINFVKMVERNRKLGVFLSPAAAYQELPPSRRKSIEASFNQFTKDYLPTFREDPNSTPVSRKAYGEEPERFVDLTPERQVTISCAYASLIAMNILYRASALKDVEKFVLYIDYCSEFLDLISLKELTIARYVFSPDKGITDRVRRIKVSMIKNFIKTKKRTGENATPSELIKQVALNGANDLRLIYAADTVDNSHEQNGNRIIHHDVWIATSDEKLYEFCCACPGYLISNSYGPMGRFVEGHLEIKGTNYWEETIEIQQRRLAERSRRAVHEPDMDRVRIAALEIEDHLSENKAGHFLETRAWRSLSRSQCGTSG